MYTPYKYRALSWFSLLRFRQSTQAIEEQKVAEEQLGEEVTTANQRIHEIENDLCSINEQLGEAKVSSHADSVVGLLCNVKNSQIAFQMIFKLCLQKYFKCMTFWICSKSVKSVIKGKFYASFNHINVHIHIVLSKFR